MYVFTGLFSFMAKHLTNGPDALGINKPPQNPQLYVLFQLQFLDHPLSS